jgi:hypothetical protein
VESLEAKNEKYGISAPSVRYLRNDKMRLDRFIELANITNTNPLEPCHRSPELYEIYS